MTSIVENMLTGFHSKADATRAAREFEKLPNVLTAKYHDANSVTPGKWARYAGLGHCVRLVLVSQ